MTHFLEVVAKVANVGKSLMTIVFEMTKSFDQVPYRKLLAKIEVYCIALFSPHMTYWKHVLRVKRNSSSPCSITTAATQRSVLGPLPFHTYIHDIPGHQAQHFTLVRRRREIFVDFSPLHSPYNH